MPAVLTTAAVDTFEHIIRQQTVAELVPFLLNLPKADVLAVRRKTRSLQRELDQFVELEKGLIGSSWGRRGTPEQDWMLFLAGLRTYSRKEALTSSFGVRWIEPGERPAFWTILEHTRPDWLGDWLQRWLTSNRWNTPQYRLLRELEDRQLIDYQPALFAASAPALLHEISRRYQPMKTVPTNLAEQVLAELQADATLLTRDLPLVFDFDTSVDTAQLWAQDERPTRNGLFIGNWQDWYAQHPPQTVRWAELLPALVESGHLDRADLLTRCLLALRRDFRRPLLTWFRNLYLALRPDPADQLARQGELVELLAHPLPLVVNFALDQLKGIWLDPAFNAAPLLQYAEGLMTRVDLKTSLRGLLTGLDKLQRYTPALAPALAPLYVGALANADAGVQERAARLLAAQLGARKPVLSTDAAAATQAAISQYADLLGATARGLLTPYLAAPEATDELPAEVYVPQLAFVPELSADTAIEPVRDWHELLFLTGQVLQHNDPVALERWVDGLIRLRRQFPAGYTEALQPYLVQVLPSLKGRSEEAQAAILHQPQSTGHTGLVQALLQGWAGGFTVPLVEQVNIRAQYSISDPLVELEQQRLVVAERRLSELRPLPLLSTPTHFPAWVAPTALVQRLLAHEAALQLPAPADLALALARTARAHAADAAAARQQLPQLRHEGLRELLTWFLAPEPPPLPAALTGRKSVLRQFTERLGQLIPRPAAPPTLEEALPWLWAVAARTRQPEAELPELRALTEYPGVAAPWAPSWQITPKSHRYVDTWKIGRPEHVTRWQELELRQVPASRAVPSRLLLYSLHAGYAREQYASWQLQADFAFLANMLPNYPAPLYWHALRSADIRSGEQSSSGLISQALTTLLYPGPVFDEAATLLLAVGLGYGAAECRVLALEVLLAAIDNGRLDAGALGTTLGQLLATELMPVQRLADTLAQARAIGPRTDDALRQLLETALPLLPAAPLRNTKKLLDLYADLLGRMRQLAPPAVQVRLRDWAGVAALKKTAAGLQKELA